MHRIGFVFYVTFFCCVFSGKAQTELKDTVVIHFCGEEPQFPGGVDSLGAYLKRTIVYPQTAIDKRIEGKCWVKLHILANGKVGEVEVLRGVPNCPECNEEALRALKLMPDWIPTKIGGKAVNDEVFIPITFRL